MMPRAVPKKLAPAADLVEEFDCEQGGAEWHELHRGVPSASRFAAIMAESDIMRGRAKLLDQMAAHVISGIAAETYSNDAMRRGKRQEPALIQDYAFAHDCEVRRVGFVRRTIKNPLGEDLVVGCSPDGMIGADGVLETKSLQPDLLVRLIDQGRFPSEHRWQCHGVLWVTGRAWCDLRIGYEGFPAAATFRIVRDEDVIASMRNSVEAFAYDLRQLVKRVKEKGKIR